MNTLNTEYKDYPISKYFDICSLVTTFEYTYDSNHYFDGEIHDFWELICVVEGTVNVTADDRIYELEKNQIIFHRPLEFHRLWSVKGTNPHLIVVSFKTSQPFEIKETVYNVRDKIVDELKNLINLAEDIFLFDDICVVGQKEEKQIDLQFFMNRLELLILSVLKKSVTLDITVKNNVSASNYELIVNVLKENINKKLSLDDIAELCNMSKSNLKKTFSKYANQGIMEYFNHLKVLEGIRLLKNGLTVGEASQSLGFTEQNYFSQVFKRITGFSPTNYFNK